jgi:hypothetical protein
MEVAAINGAFRACVSAQSFARKPTMAIGAVPQTSIQASLHALPIAGLLRPAQRAPEARDEVGQVAAKIDQHREEGAEVRRHVEGQALIGPAKELRDQNQVRRGAHR